MYVVHDLAGRYWNGHAFSSYYTHTAKRFLSFVDASLKASELKAIVGTTDQNALQPLLRLYDLIAKSEATGVEKVMTNAPVTHDECCTMRSKLTAHTARSLILSEVEYQVVYVEDLAGIALTWVIAVLSGKKVDLGLSKGEKAIYLNDRGVVTILNPIEDSVQAHLLTYQHDVVVYQDDPVMPKAVITPDKNNPFYFYKQYGETRDIAVMKCVVRSLSGNDRVLIPKWLVA